MRVALALLIAVVQVAGSWLCCCGPDRWLADRSAPAVSSHCDELAVASAEPATCPHCQQAEKETNPAKAPRKHSPLPDQCPCGGMKIESVPPPVATTAHGTADVFPAPFPADPSPSLTLAVSGVVPGGVSELPFLPAESRLFVHHVLRC